MWEQCAIPDELVRSSTLMSRPTVIQIDMGIASVAQPVLSHRIHGINKETFVESTLETRPIVKAHRGTRENRHHRFIHWWGDLPNKRASSGVAAAVTDNAFWNEMTGMLLLLDASRRADVVDGG